MDLKSIGFYTLSDKRAATSSVSSPLYRCEMILTDECNFKCPYCRGLREDLKGELHFDLATEILNIWISEGLKNVRFSGGEPTLYSGLDSLVHLCKENNVEYIAVSTNGSANLEYYKYLINCGVNDFSISLDSGCCAVGDEMAGNIENSWTKTVENIKALSKLVNVTVGVVFTDENIFGAIDTVKFADKLGVDDIRVIPAAQYDKALYALSVLEQPFLDKYPVLNYRLTRAKNGNHVRGLDGQPDTPCRLVLDDMAVAQGYHFPCIIYMREYGDPIGYIGPNIRQERENWMLNHSPINDPICSKMCLDVCVDYNLKATQLNKG